MATSGAGNRMESAARESARRLADQLRSFRIRFVLAESCTGGLAAALMTGNPGISEFFCGSAVTYRQVTKQHWLDVSANTLSQHTAESQSTTDEMALGVLSKTPEAEYAAAITGHLGPDAPAEIDGLVYITVAQRSGQAIEIVRQTSLKLESGSRHERQYEATRNVLDQICLALSGQD